MDEHDKRRIDLAEWYAREAILSGCTGDLEAMDAALEAANEYLSVLTGKASRLTEPGDIIALCCQLSERGYAYAT